jgi:hypothetical protein
MTRGGWHVAEEELRAYAAGTATAPWLWSTEAHLAACDECRTRLAGMGAARRLVDAGWARLDAELDVPVPGPLERILVRLGVRDDTARLLAATPMLRLSWLAAVASTLALTALVGNLAQQATTPIAFLAVAPVLPLVGVAVSYGPRVDPTYEIAVVSPTHTFRLLLLRCAAVLVVTTALSAAASLALPDYGLVVLAWVLPAFALTLVSLALTPRLGAVTAAAVTGVGWAVAVAATVRLDTGASALFTPAGQLALAAAGLGAAFAVHKLRPAFDWRTR